MIFINWIASQKNAVLSVTRTQCVKVILGVPVTYLLVGIPVVWHVLVIKTVGQRLDALFVLLSFEKNYKTIQAS
jgi:hypothetical protein